MAGIGDNQYTDDLGLDDSEALSGHDPPFVDTGNDLLFAYQGVTSHSNNGFSSGEIESFPPQYDIGRNLRRAAAADEEEEEEEGEEEQEAEADPLSNAPIDQPGTKAGSRQARTRWWPRQSDAHIVLPSLQQHKVQLGDNKIVLGKGENSGRNKLAIFSDTDDTPRLASNIQLEGRRNTQWQGYPSPQYVFLPVGLSLAEVLAHYPNHVWNDGLRLFMAEGWIAEKMWHGLPTDARNTGASTRQWNYLQQALGREADKIAKEMTGRKRVPEKRPKKDEPDTDEDEDDTDNGFDTSDFADAMTTTNDSVVVTEPQTGLYSFSPSASYQFDQQHAASGRRNVVATRRGGSTGLAQPYLVD